MTNSASSIRMPKWYKALPSVLAILTLLVTALTPLWQESRQHKTLEISYGGGWDPLLCTGSPERVSFVYDGVARDRMYLSFYVLKNTGARAIERDDFFEPLRVAVADGMTPLGIVNVGATGSTWSQLGLGSYQIGIPAINPGEQIVVTLASEGSGKCSVDGVSATAWRWSGAIKNGVLITSPGSDWSPWWSKVQVVLFGVYVWVALICAASFFYVSALLVSAYNWRMLKRWSVIMPIFILSVANGENIATLSAAGWNAMWPVAKYFLVAHSGIIVAAAFFLVIRRRRSAVLESGKP